MQVRVISYPEQRNEDGCPFVSSCDEAAKLDLDLKTDGRLVGILKKEDESCLRGRRWNFDLPFLQTFDHGQILVSWKHSGSIGTIPLVKVYGIADTSMKI